MKLKIIIDQTKDEEILITCHKRDNLVDKIESLVNNEPPLTGYLNDTIVLIDLEKVQCFVTEDNKVVAYLDDEKYVIKKKIYELEEILDNNFIKTNQGCIANIKHIKKFYASFAGSLDILFENGYRSYVSRRQLKSLKERLGL